MVIEFGQQASVAVAETAEIRIKIFTVACRKARHLPSKVQEVLSLAPEDPYLELHLPVKIEAPTPKEVIRSFRRGFEAIGQFLIETGIKPRYLIGITHQKLAHAATLFGFSLLAIREQEVDEVRLGRLHGGYQMTHNFVQGKPEGEVMVCYQPIDRFMGRFPGQSG